MRQTLALLPRRFTLPILLNQQYDAAILPQDDRIGTDVSAIAAHILSCPQIKRAIVKRTDDGGSADEPSASGPPRCGRLGWVANTSP